MKRERIILHSDLNNFFASVECLYNSELKGRPLAVTGDPDLRHGVVLAKNAEAKARGVGTGDPLWMARQKCPGIIFVKPRMDLYRRFAVMAQEIYTSYTDQVEPFGIDECWLDVTGSTRLFGSGKQIADEIRSRIKSELGITASVGVSFNKIFAKLGSDLKKPDATTVISRESFRETVWPLPASELLNTGRATFRKLRDVGIRTVGELASADPVRLRKLLGLEGYHLWVFANGMDFSPVAPFGQESEIKTIGNSTTAPRSLVSDREIRLTLYVLAESVSARMREQNFICRTVKLSVRDEELFQYERQGKLAVPCRTAEELAEKAFELFRKNRPEKPVRSLGLRACDLSVSDFEQLSLLPETAVLQRREELEKTVDRIRERFGHFKLRRAVMLSDPELSALDPKGDNAPHPVSYFR